MNTDATDDYAWYCECFRCDVCDGEGECNDGDDGDGDFWTCNHCGGSGINPNAPEYEGPPPI